MRPKVPARPNPQARSPGPVGGPSPPRSPHFSHLGPKRARGRQTSSPSAFLFPGANSHPENESFQPCTPRRVAGRFANLDSPSPPPPPLPHGQWGDTSVCLADRMGRMGLQIGVFGTPRFHSLKTSPSHKALRNVRGKPFPQKRCMKTKTSSALQVKLSAGALYRNAPALSKSSLMLEFLFSYYLVNLFQ